ncbi:hypothetical protein AGMMS50239_35340 [Bacteroidia bacterium]|nr:hypothetical protein AGMMS50239_35340 [Bacteroidia bacterium]
MFREYVVEGGITYLGAVSGLKARVGLNRLELIFSIADATTTKVGVYWNDYQDSVMINIGETSSIQQIINLPEGQYSLFVKSFNKDGDSSNPVELITHTVGDSYFANLVHRGIKTKSTSFNNDLSIEWHNLDGINGARFTYLIYTDTLNKEKRIFIANETIFTQIEDYKQGTTFKRITYYSPDNQWLDTIIPAVIPESSLMVDKKIGKVVNYSTQNASNAASNFYDGNPANMWLTDNNYPEYASIDLGYEVPVSGFGIWPSYQQTNGRADPRAPTKIKFEGSLDNTVWTVIGEFDYDNGMYYYERIFETPVTNARYVRITGVECISAPVYNTAIGGAGTKLMNLAELDVFFRIE